MSFLTGRAAAIAPAAIFLFALASTGGSGALAQDQVIHPAIADTVSAQSSGTAAPADQIRFEATEVVQPLHQDSVDQAPAANLRELVDSMPADAVLSRDLTCLASAIYYEARGETLEGQLAVGQVIVNRAGSGKFPQDYCGVVTQPGQFSFVSGGSIPQAHRDSPAWQRASAIARIAHQELWDSKADDALYFHASRVRPVWASRKPLLARIDSHIFYR
jgi:spore germination cell wall hydrolase CwlJ-like protein